MRLKFAASLCITFFALQLFLSPVAHAHKFEYAAINTTLRFENPKTIKFHTEVPKKIYISENPEKDKRYSARLGARFYEFNISRSLIVNSVGEKCKFSIISHTVTEQRSSFNGRFDCKNDIKKIEDLKISNKLFDRWLKKYDNFIKVEIGGKTWDLAFNKEKTRYPEQVAASKPSYKSIKPVAAEFTKSGIEHIWKGYDHLLFLLAAILLLRRIKNIILVVTSFTVAHSITLALAALDIVTLPSNIIEPVIILSIVAVALRNLFILRKKEDIGNITERWAMTFGFGLVHGLGFAGALKETGIPDQYFAGALAFFNVGIELGQLAVLVLVVPILLLLFKTEKRRLILSIVSLITIVIAIIFFLQRVTGQ